MAMHHLSSVTNMDFLYRGIEIQNARMVNPTNHSMKGRYGNKVVVEGQFDDAVNETPLQSFDLKQASENQLNEVVANATEQGVPVATTILMPPPPPLLSYYPAVVVVQSSMMPSQTPLTKMIILSAAPSLSPTTVIQEQIPPSQSFHNGFRVTPTESNAPTTSRARFAGNRYVAIAPRPVNYEIPIAPRPAATTNIPIVPRPKVRFQVSETKGSSTKNQRISSLKKLPTQTKYRHKSSNKENCISCDSSAYSTNILDQIMKQQGDGAPFDDLLCHHPNAALIPHWDVPREERVPMMKIVVRDDLCLFPVAFPKEMRPKDVLLGRGMPSSHYTGNLFFRQLISYYREAYRLLPKGGKRQLSRNICNYVRLSGGRFLEKSRQIQNENHWYECGDVRAMAKCAQALRETTRFRDRCGTKTARDEEEEEEEEGEDSHDEDENRTTGSSSSESE